MSGTVIDARAPIVLPFELERDIFELTTRAFPNQGPKLTTVSKYVQKWVEMLLYETIILELPNKTTRLFLQTFDSRPAEFFAQTVKRIHVTSVLAFDDAKKVMSACAGAVEVGAWVYPNSFQDNFLSCINREIIQRLSMPLEALWSINSRHAVFEPALFPRLTHLEIVNPPGLYPPLQLDWNNIVMLPALTHLALGDLCGSNHKHYLPAFDRVLKECACLQVLVLVSNDEWLVQEIQSKGITEDARVVVRDDFTSPVSVAEYWRGMRQGGPDMWTRAEDLVPIQRAQIERNREIQQDLRDLIQ